MNQQKKIHTKKPQKFSDFLDVNRKQALSDWAPIWQKEVIMTWEQRKSCLETWHKQYTPFFPSSLNNKIPALYLKKHEEFVKNQLLYLTKVNDLSQKEAKDLTPEEREEAKELFLKEAQKSFQVRVDKLKQSEKTPNQSVPEKIQEMKLKEENPNEKIEKLRKDLERVKVRKSSVIIEDEEIVLDK